MKLRELIKTLKGIEDSYSDFDIAVRAYSPTDDSHLFHRVESSLNGVHICCSKIKTGANYLRDYILLEGCIIEPTDVD